MIPKTYDEVKDEYRYLRVVCIYDAFHCRVCDRKTPHVELIHHTANNVNLKEHPWDKHRLEKGMVCLAHCDIDLPSETLVDQSFLHKETGVYVWVRLLWKQSGYLTDPAQDGYPASTEHYSIDFKYNKGTKKGEWLGGGRYGINAVANVLDIPFGNQKAMDAFIVQIGTEFVKKIFSHLIPKDQPKQLELF